MIYARDLPTSGIPPFSINAHIGRNDEGVTQEKKMITKDKSLQTHQNEDQILRMYAILRADLQMTNGKSASQSGHAFKLLTKNIIEDDPQLAREYFADGMGTNVVLKAKNLSAIKRAMYEAKAAGLFYALITDSGHIMLPHFDGSPIITALGIGPCRRSEIDHITKRINCIA